MSKGPARARSDTSRVKSSGGFNLVGTNGTLKFYKRIFISSSY